MNCSQLIKSYWNAITQSIYATALRPIARSAIGELPWNRVCVNLFPRHIRDLSRQCQRQEFDASTQLYDLPFYAGRKYWKKFTFFSDHNKFEPELPFLTVAQRNDKMFLSDVGINESLWHMFLMYHDYHEKFQSVYILWGNNAEIFKRSSSIIGGHSSHARSGDCQDFGRSLLPERVHRWPPL